MLDLVDPSLDSSIFSIMILPHLGQEILTSSTQQVSLAAVSPTLAILKWPLMPSCDLSWPNVTYNLVNLVKKIVESS